MINPNSRSLKWITEAAQKAGVRDVALIEKTIRAFSLLEALALSGCPFVFKGGSSLMLHLNTSKRLSIDIDVICPPGTIIEDYLKQYAEEYGFGKASKCLTTSTRLLSPFACVVLRIQRNLNFCKMALVELAVSYTARNIP